jgi:hypothetical protein
MRPQRTPPIVSRRRGFAAVLAMLFLVLFAVMSLGLYSAGTVSTQVSYNDTNTMRSLVAAENGMQFIRYQLDTLDIPYTNPSQSSTALFNAILAQLHTKLDNTHNMAEGPTYASYYNPTTDVTASGANVIYIPGRTGTTTAPVQHWMSLDGVSSFYVTLTQGDGSVVNGTTVPNTSFVVKVVGRYASSTSTPNRAVQLVFNPAENAPDIFNYGVATKSAVSMAGNVTITGTTGHPENGSVLSATTTAHPLSMTGGPSISGNFAYTNTAGTNTFGNGTIAGESPTNSDFHNHVLMLNTSPDFPVIDTTVFKQAVTTWNAPSGSVWTNVVLPPNYSGNINNVTINGILYVMQPNNLTFRGTTTINGAIVVDGAANGSTYATNSMSFAGSVASKSMSSITDSTVLAQLTTAEKGLSGAFLLAPNFSIGFTGNFGTVNGTIVSDKLSFSGNAGGTIKGTIVNLQDSGVSLSGTSDIVIASQGTSNYPSGVYFGNHYTPSAPSYAEVHP